MNAKYAEYVSSRGTVELIGELKQQLEEYRLATLDPDMTQSIPSLELMIEIAGELQKRLENMS